MKKSIIAFAAFLGLGLAGMGALGGVIYLAAAPLLIFIFPPINTWHGDWVWPSTIIAGMAWSFSFLVAGFAHKKLRARNTPIALCRTAYAAILWIAAVLTWAVILTGRF